MQAAGGMFNARAVEVSGTRIDFELDAWAQLIVENGEVTGRRFVAEPLDDEEAAADLQKVEAVAFGCCPQVVVLQERIGRPAGVANEDEIIGDFAGIKERDERRPRRCVQ